MSLATGKFVGINRFLIQKRLGEGGFGLVFQAYDIEQDEIVALKILHEWNAETLYDLKKEFRSIANITHPNLVTLYELFSEDSQWFFTMELVVGKKFFDYIWETDVALEYGNSSDNAFGLKQNNQNKELPQKINILPQYSNKHISLNLSRLRSSLKQLVEGIQAIHQVNKLHCDIKPSNVLVTSHGQVKILDFGLTQDFNPRKLAGNFGAGTPFYMSPEQSASQVLSPATDWYSVGAILYESLTGNWPVKGSSIEEILANKNSFLPTHPKKLFPELPDDLSDLCIELMDLNPTNRPSGKEILARLASQPLEVSQNQAVESTIIFSSQEVSFIGRKNELSQLEEAFHSVKNQGEAITVFVHGSSGMGKSTLTQHFLDQLQTTEQKLVVLTGRCYQQESIPYKAFDSIIDSLSQYLKQLAILNIAVKLPTDISLLARLFPVLQQLPEVRKIINQEIKENSLKMLNFQELRRKAFMALRELLTCLAKQSSIVIYIDDLQWGDLDSVALLTELLCPPDPPKLLLIATYRTEEIASSPLLKTLLPLIESGGLGETKQIEVGKFNFEQAKDLVLSLLNQKSLAAFSANKLPIEKILKESSGSPFFIIELANYLQNNDVEIDTVESFFTTSLDEVIKKRISQLSTPARQLLEIVSVAGQPIKLTCLKKAISSEIRKNNEFLLLKNNHLIRLRETDNQQEVEAYHDRIRESILSYLEPQILQSYHQKLALALEADPTTDSERLMVHFFKATEYAKAYNHALTAANQASQALAFDHAAELYQLAIDLTSHHQEVSPNQEQLHQLWLSLANTLTKAGRGKEAATAYLTAAKNTNKEEKIELQRRAAEEMLVSGHMNEGLLLLDEVLNLVGLRLAKTRKHAFISLIYQRLKLKLRGLKFKATSADKIDRFELLKIDTCWSVALGLSSVDTIRGADFQALNLLLSLKAGEPYRIARALSFEAAHSAAGGGKTQKRTVELLRTAKQLAEEVNNYHALGLNTFIYGFASFLQGKWKEAYDFDSEAEEILVNKCTGVHWELASTRINLLHSLLFLGRLEDLFHRVPSLLNEAQRQGDIYAESTLRYRITYMLYLAEDEVEKAKHELDEVAKLWTDNDFYQQHFWILIGRIQIALYSDNAQQAWELIINNQPALNKSFILQAQAFRILWSYLVAHSALAMLKATNNSKFLQTAIEKVKKIDKENMAWSKPLIQVCQASIALYQNKKDVAIELFKQAETAFESLDMKLYSIAAQFYYGQLIENTTGKEIVENATNSLLNNQIVAPNKIARMLLPH